jgi:Ion transport protein
MVRLTQALACASVDTNPTSHCGASGVVRVASPTSCHPRCRASHLHPASRLYGNVSRAGAALGDAPHPEDACIQPRGFNVFSMWLPQRVKAWNLFSEPQSSAAAYWVSVTVLIAILLSTVLLCLESVPDVQANATAMTIMNYVELVCMIVFAIDYAVKFWAAPSRWKFFWNFGNLLDLVSIVPWYVDVALCGSVRGCGAGTTVRSTQVCSRAAVRPLCQN